MKSVKHVKIMSSQVIKWLRLACICYLWLVSCPIRGQVELPVLQPKDYNLWSALNLQSTSKDAKWISYTITYENGTDTLIVEQSNKAKRYALPGGYNGTFSNAGHFACQDSKGWWLINLRTGNTKQFQEAESLIFSPSGKQIAVIGPDNINKRRIEILTTNGNPIKAVFNVDLFTVDPLSSKIAYSKNLDVHSSVEIIEYGKQINVINVAESNLMEFAELRWKESGSTLIFFGKERHSDEVTQLFLYNVKGNRMQSLSAKKLHQLFPTAQFAKTSGQYLKVCNDLNTVFFSYETTRQMDLVERKVEIWKGNDKKTYPQQITSHRYPSELIVKWSLIDSTLTPVNSQNESVRLLKNPHLAILTDLDKYPTWHRQNNLVDYFLTDIDKGTKKLWMEKHSSLAYNLQPSPNGKYILSFNDGNWKIYNTETHSFHSLTERLQSAFYNENEPTGGEKESFGIAGWTHNDENVVLYDRYDLWSFSCHTGKAVRLTDGRERQIRFRIPATKNFTVYNDFYENPINLNGEIVLEATGDDASSGYFVWTMKLGTYPLSYGRFKSTQGIVNGNILTYVQQTFGIAPRIVQAEVKKADRIIFTSNQQQKGYQWPTTERIIFKNTQGKTLNAIIRYPAGYDPSHLYPMVVYIYQIQSAEFHTYQFPTKYQPNGFDPHAFLSDGYLILYPDIDNEVNRPGFSALECVIAALDEVVKKGIVDEDRIGLIGHSFGGYEAGFIISQTKRFAAAVAGGAITDLQSYYLGTNLAGKPDMWRLEDQQWKMSQSLFESRETYFKNSPINYVENISTPLLSWSGKNDVQVNFQQSVEMYLALKRLNKKQILLLYPEEHHLLLKSENQLDITTRIKDWFDYFLKEDSSKEWINNALSE